MNSAHRRKLTYPVSRLNIFILFCASLSTDKTDDPVTTPTSPTGKSGSFHDLTCGNPVTGLLVACQSTSGTDSSSVRPAAVLHGHPAPFSVPPSLVSRNVRLVFLLQVLLVRLLRTSVQSGSIILVYLLLLLFFSFFYPVARSGVCPGMLYKGIIRSKSN